MTVIAFDVNETLLDTSALDSLLSYSTAQRAACRSLGP
jgi:hypothetical protein